MLGSILLIIAPSLAIAQQESGSPEGSVILQGSNVNATGYLHVYISSQWHLVCTSALNENTAAVICRELGYNGFQMFTIAGRENDTSIQYKTMANCKGDEELLDACVGHEWLMAEQTEPANNSKALCYANPPKAIQCTIKGSDEPVKELEQINLHAVKKSENHSDTIASVGGISDKENTMPKIENVKSKIEATTQSIESTSNIHTEQDAAPTFVLGTKLEIKPKEKTIYPITTSENKSNSVQLPTNLNTKEDKLLELVTEVSSEISNDSVHVLKLMSSNRLPNKFVNVTDETTETMVDYETQISTQQEAPNSNANLNTKTDSSDGLSLNPETTVGTAEDTEETVQGEVTMDNKQIEVTDASLTAEYTQYPTDRYLYFKQSDLVEPTTNTMQPSIAKVVPKLVQPSLPTSTEPSIQIVHRSSTQKHIYMVTPENYHKPTTTHATNPSRVNRPIHVAKEAHLPKVEEAHPTSPKIIHPGLRPGYPWGGRYGALGDREIDKLHPRFLDSKNEFDFKDCPGYTDTFVGSRQEGQITSPSYPGKYPNHAHCIWRIHVHSSQHIRLQIMDLLTGKGDILKIFESGHLGEQPRLIRKFEGKVLDLEQMLEDKSNNSVTIISNHSVVYLEFSSNDKGTDRGFLVDYKAFPHIPTKLSTILAADNIQFVQTLVGVLVAIALVVMVAAVVIYRLKFPISKSDVHRRLYQEAVNDLHKDYETMSKEAQPMNGDVASLNVFNKGTLQMSRDVAYENPAFSTETPDMSSVFMEAGKNDEDLLNWGNDDEEETSVIFSIFSRKNKKKKKPKSVHVEVVEEQTAMFAEQPDTACDLIELDPATKEQAGFNSIQSALGQSSSLGKVKCKKGKKMAVKNIKSNAQREVDNLIQFDSPKKLDEKSVAKEMEMNGKKDEVAKPAPPLDQQMIGRVTAEMISPREFICPITTKIMKQPVRAPDGYVYEKRAICEWIEKHGLSPISRTQMKAQDLIPEENVAAKVKEWRKKRKLQRLKMENDLSRKNNVKC